MSHTNMEQFIPNRTKIIETSIDLITKTTPFMEKPKIIKAYPHNTVYVFGYDHKIFQRELVAILDDANFNIEEYKKQETEHLRQGCNKLYSWIKQKIPHLLENNNQYAALISICQQCGYPNIINSDIINTLYFYKLGAGQLLKNWREQYKEDISHNWLIWVCRQGSIQQDLLKRRKAELQLFLSNNLTF